VSRDGLIAIIFRIVVKADTELYSVHGSSAIQTLSRHSFLQWDNRRENRGMGCSANSSAHLFENRQKKSPTLGAGLSCTPRLACSSHRLVSLSEVGLRFTSGGHVVGSRTLQDVLGLSCPVGIVRVYG